MPPRIGITLPGIRQPDAAAEKENHVLGRVLTAAAAAATATATATVAAGAKLKHAGVFQEEVSLLGKEQVEAGQVDLLLVGLDL